MEKLIDVPGLQQGAAAVECEQVVLRTRKKTILDQVSLAVPAGSITGLLGPNGAGKSTLLRLITGLTRPDAGSITLFGQPAGEQMLGQLSMLPDRGGLAGMAHCPGMAGAGQQSVPRLEFRAGATVVRPA